MGSKTAAPLQAGPLQAGPLQAGPLLTGLLLVGLLAQAVPGWAAGGMQPSWLFCRPLSTNGQPVLDRADDPAMRQYHGVKPNGIQRLFVIPADRTADPPKEVEAYLQNNPEFKRSLELFGTARSLRYSLLAKKALPDLGTPRAAALSQAKKALTSPLVLLDRPPQANFGFSMLPMPTVVAESADDLGTVRLVAPECIIVAGLGKRTIASTITIGLLGTLVAHEAAHAAMLEVYGTAYDLLAKDFKGSHQVTTISNPAFALLEGWAEAISAWVDPTASLRGKEREARIGGVSDFYFDANDDIRLEKYLWIDPAAKDGRLKNASQLICTEGVVATILYRILSSRAIAAPVEKLLTVMARTQPKSLPELIKGYLAECPADRQTVLRIVLETTRYRTMSRPTAAAYAAYRAARAAQTSGRGEAATLRAAKTAYEEAKEEAFAQAVKGAEVFSDLGPALAVFGAGYTFDLNTADLDVLMRSSLEKEDALKVLAAREAVTYFTGDPLGQLKKAIGEDVWQKKYGRYAWGNK
jgi:hypothetical protein